MYHATRSYAINPEFIEWQQHSAMKEACTRKQTFNFDLCMVYKLAWDEGKKNTKKFAFV